MIPLPPEKWDASLSHVIDDMNGQPINVHRLMANHPDLLKAWWDFRQYSVNGGELGERNAELLILRVAVHMKDWYEWGSHVHRALTCDLTLKEIERVKQGPQAPGWSAAEAVLLKAVDELISLHRLKPATQADLSKNFNARQVMDIIAIHGMYVILACMINTWGLELDSHVQEKLPESVTKDNFEEEIL